jgi:hypothetical protein
VDSIIVFKQFDCVVPCLLSIVQLIDKYFFYLSERPLDMLGDSVAHLQLLHQHLLGVHLVVEE